MNVYELIQILVELPPDAELAIRDKDGLLVEVSAEDFVIVPQGRSYIPKDVDGELLGPAIVVSGDAACVWSPQLVSSPQLPLDDNHTAAKQGEDDAATYYNELRSYDRPEKALAYVQSVRAGQSPPPSDALINAMGRKWILGAATGAHAEDSDETWDAVGLPWCKAYDRAFLLTLERIARS